MAIGLGLESRGLLLRRQSVQLSGCRGGLNLTLAALVSITLMITMLNFSCRMVASDSCSLFQYLNQPRAPAEARLSLDELTGASVGPGPRRD